MRGQGPAPGDTQEAPGLGCPGLSSSARALRGALRHSSECLEGVSWDGTCSLAACHWASTCASVSSCANAEQ